MTRLNGIRFWLYEVSPYKFAIRRRAFAISFDGLIAAMDKYKKDTATLDAFILGAAITALISIGVFTLNARVRRVQYMSSIEAPTAATITEIRITLDADNLDLAKKKLRLFETRYNAFREGGSAPEQFQSEITSLQ